MASTLLISMMLGVAAGLRTTVPVAAVSWAAAWGWISLDTTWLWWLALPWVPWIASLAVLTEFVTDQLPSTPSRTVPLQFGARLVSGGLAGMAVGVPTALTTIGFLGGIAGAVIGTLGGRAFRAWLAAAFRSDPPAALIEDALALALAAAAINLLS